MITWPGLLPVSSARLLAEIAAGARRCWILQTMPNNYPAPDYYDLPPARSFPVDAAGADSADARDGPAAALPAASGCRDEAPEQGPVAGLSQDRHRDDHHQVWAVSQAKLLQVRI